MQATRSIVTAILAIAALGLAGCSSDEPAPAGPAAAAPAETPRTGAQTLDIPRTTPPAPAPSGQPGQAPRRMYWTAPEHWVEEPPANSMRVAQYRVPGAAGDAECVVFYFGPGQGGDPVANANRWAGQFTQPDGGSTLDMMTVVELETARVPAHLVEIRGTYEGGMSSPTATPGAMLLGGIAQGSDAPWFFKFVGPEETVRAERAAFVALMESANTDG